MENTAAHEFGHMLNVGDAYTVNNPSPKYDIMRWYNEVEIKMTNYDVLMLLKGGAYNKLQTWDKIKKSDVK